MIFLLNYIELKAASTEIFVKVKTADAKRSCSVSLFRSTRFVAKIFYTTAICDSSAGEVNTRVVEGLT